MRLLGAILAGVIAGGCAARESEVGRQEVVRAAEREGVADPDVEVMRTMWGKWKVDLKATMRANSGLAAAMRADVRQELEAHPFELEITDRDYISRGATKTIWDRYRVLKVEGDWVQLDLSNAEGGGQNRGGPKLRVLEGKLMIATGRAVVVMGRQ